MERTKKINPTEEKVEEPKVEKANTGVIKWKKIGGGGLILKNKLIKPGQIFEAHPDEIPKAFRDTCIPLDEVVVPKEPQINPVKFNYKAIPRGKSNLWWDVVNDNGKVMNQKALTKEVAEQFVKDLEK